MTPEQKYRNWLKSTPYIKFSQIAIDSGSSKQVMNYWLHEDPRGSSFSPEAGIVAYTTLLRTLCQRHATTEEFSLLKKYIVLSQLAERFFDCRSSTINIMISRKGIVHYHGQILAMCRWLLFDVPVVKARKNINNQSSKVVYKFKIP